MKINLPNTLNNDEKIKKLSSKLSPKKKKHELTAGEIAYCDSIEYGTSDSLPDELKKEVN